MIDRKAVNEYLDYRDLTELKESQFTIIEIVETRQPIDFYEIENAKLTNR
jgi:hypothetical protein